MWMYLCIIFVSIWFCELLCWLNNLICILQRLSGMWKFIRNGNKVRIGGSHSGYLCRQGRKSSWIVNGSEASFFRSDLFLQNYSGEMAIIVFIVVESSVPHKRWFMLCGAPLSSNIWLSAPVKGDCIMGLSRLFPFKLLMIKMSNN